MEEAARAALEKIEASGGFAASDRLRRFLRFAVEAKLHGQERQIKESIIGREVYDRGADYDPRTDPIVRVEARRLRAKLKAYYDGEGQNDPVHIEFPKGTYVPVIHFLQPVRPVQPVRQDVPPPAEFPAWAAAGVVLLIMTLGAASQFLGSPSETIAVAPARWAGEDAGSAGNVDQKLVTAIASELTKRRTARVVAFPPPAHAQGARKEVRQVAKDLGATKVLMVDVQAGGGATRVTIYLLDTKSNEKMWITDFSESGLETSEEQLDLARSVADEFEAKNCKAPPYWSYRISMA